MNPLFTSLLFYVENERQIELAAILLLFLIDDLLEDVVTVEVTLGRK